MAKWKRKRVTVDFPLQGTFCFRITCYWVSCLCVIAAISSMQLFLTDETMSRDWGREYGQILVLSLFALPLAILDALIYSNKFAGPMYRIRTELKNLANNNQTRKVNLRPGDFYADAAADLNALIDRLQPQESNEPPTEPIDVKYPNGEGNPEEALETVVSEHCL